MFTFGDKVVISDSSSNALTINGGLSLGGNLSVSGTITSSGGSTGIISDTTESVSTTSGALQVAGGAGIVGNLFLGGNFTSLSTANATSTTTGAFKIAGGAGIAGNLLVGGISVVGTGGSGNELLRLNAERTFSFVQVGAEASSTLALKSNMDKGFHFQGSTGFSVISMYPSPTAGDGYISINSTLDTSSKTTGSLQILGGAAIGKSLYVNDLIRWPSLATNYANPSTSVRSVGTRLLLLSSLSATESDFAIGIGHSTLWNSVPSSSRTFKWFAADALLLTLDGTGNLISTSTTDSSSLTTGALQVPGGVGISKNLNVGAKVNVGNSSLMNTTNANRSINIIDNAAVIRMWRTMATNLNSNPSIEWIYGTAATVSDIGNQWWDMYLENDEIRIRRRTGGVAQDSLSISNTRVFIPNDLHISGTTQSTSTTTGALQIAGGVGIGGDLHTGASVYFGGFDLKLGAADQVSRGDSGNSRALVKHTNNTLVLNYGNDFTGGVRVDSNVSIAGNAIKEFLRFSTERPWSFYQQGTGSATALALRSSSLAKAFLFQDPTEMTILEIYVGASNAENRVSVTATAQSTSSTTGALTVAGGVGIAGNLYANNLFINTNAVATQAYVTGLGYLTTATAASTYQPIITAGTGLTKSGNTLSVNVAQTQITSLGTLTSLTSSGNVVITSTTESSSSTTGALQVAGGASINKNLRVGGITQSSSTTSGALQVAGGVGIVGNAYIGGSVVIPYSATLPYINLIRDDGIGLLQILAVNTGPSSYVRFTAGSGGIGRIVFHNGTSDYWNMSSSSITTTAPMSLTSTLAVSGNMTASGTNVDFPNLKGLNYLSSGGIRLYSNFSDGFSYIQSGDSNRTVGSFTPMKFAPLGSTVSILTIAADNVRIDATNDTLSSTTGALQVAGGATIAKSLTVGYGIKADETPMQYPPILPLTAASTNITTASYGNGTYVASASTISNSFWEAYNGFRETSGHPWSSTAAYDGTTGVYSGAVTTTDVNATVHTGEWLQLQMPAPKVIRSFTILPRLDFPAGSPKTFTLLASNDGTTWTLIFDQSTALTWTNNVSKTFTVTNLSSWTFFRIVVKSTVGGDQGNYTQFSMFYSSPVTNGGLLIQNTTDSLSVTTGALQVAGGASIAKNLFIGGGSLNLDNATSNLVTFRNGGLGPPTLTTRSVGTKIVLCPNLSAITGDIALGIDVNTFWFSISRTVDFFKWYAGTTNIMQLTGTGQLNLTSTSDSSSLTTGALQVAGGVSIAKSLFAAKSFLGYGSGGEVFSLPLNVTVSTLNIQSATHNGGGTTLAAPEPVLNLIRSGVSTQSWGNLATFYLSRYEMSGVSSRTQLDISLSHNTLISGQDTNVNVLRLRSDGSVYTPGVAVVGTPADGKELLRLNTERPWSFYQVGTGANTNLALRCSSNKSFLIQDSLANSAFEVKTSDNRVIILTTLDSSSSTTGALQVAGGAAIAKTLYVGENAIHPVASIELGANRTSDGHSYIDFHSTVGSDYEFRIIRSAGVNGNLDVVQNGTGLINIVGTSRFASTTDSSSALTGALQVAGGVGIAGNLYVGGYHMIGLPAGNSSTMGNMLGFTGTYGDVSNVNSVNSCIVERKYGGTESSELLIFKGNDIAGSPGPDVVRIAAAEFYVDLLSANGSYNYTTNTVPAVSRKLSISNTISTFTTPLVIESTLDSSSSTTGALNVAGGVGIAKNLYVGSSITASGEITAFSDIKLKCNIETITDALDAVVSLRGVRYELKDETSGKKHLGVVAQEVQDILPEIVQKNGSDDTLSVAYGKLTAVLIEAIKELNVRVQLLESKLKDD